MNTLQNRHILLVDDMPSIHEDFRKILAARPAAGDLDDVEAALFGQAAPPSVDGFEHFAGFLRAQFDRGTWNVFELKCFRCEPLPQHVDSWRNLQVAP